MASPVRPEIEQSPAQSAWLVIVKESAADTQTTEFECMAVDARDAEIQASCHFEDCVVVRCSPK